MKRSLIFISSLVIGLFLSGVPVYAATTTLSLSGSRDGSSAQLSIHAENATGVSLRYQTTGGGTQTLYLGKTDPQGYLSTTVSTATYDIQPGSSVYIVSDAGSTSSSATWPTPPASKISLPLSSITVGLGENMVMPVNNLTYGTAVVAGNSNSAIATATLNGPIMTLHGKALGTTVMSICVSVAGTLSNCQTLTVTVQSSVTASFSVSNASPLVLVNKSTPIYINGVITNTSNYYITTNTNPSAVQASISTNVITLTGSRAGTATVTVCQTNGSCIPLSVTIFDAGNSQTMAPILTKTAVSLTVGQSTTVGIAGVGGYFISNNNHPEVASAGVSGSNVSITALAAGSRILSICDTNNQCSTLTIQVSALVLTPPTTSTASTPSGSTSSSGTPAASSYHFTTYLTRGSEGAAVLALQKLLTTQGFFSVTPNGYFGPATEKGVLAFQKAHGIDQLGVVGPATRAALNKL